MFPGSLHHLPLNHLVKRSVSKPYSCSLSEGEIKKYTSIFTISANNQYSDNTIILCQPALLALEFGSCAKPIKNYREEIMVVQFDEWCSWLGHLLWGPMGDFIFAHHHFYDCHHNHQSSSWGVWCPATCSNDTLGIQPLEISTNGRHLHRKDTGC